MRLLGIGETCDLGALYLRLIADGHDVKVSATEPKASGTLAGFVQRTADWRSELDWVRAAGRDGVVEGARPDHFLEAEVALQDRREGRSEELMIVRDERGLALHRHAAITPGAR